MLKFGTLCSGIEAASEAWLPLGWQCEYVAEVEPFPCAYLAEVHGAGRPRYLPAAANLKTMDKITWRNRLINFGDVTQIQAAELPPVDILGAGFPCQDFSIAGLRASLNGARGNLSTIGVRLILEAAELGLVRGALLEQVPDVLNTADNAWGNILGALVGADDAIAGLDHGGKWPSQGMVAGPRARVAWRVLDAQWFELAQRRERVWAVVDFGNGPDPAAVLLERKSVHGNPAARRSADEGTAHPSHGRAVGGGRNTGRTEDGGTAPEVGTPFGCDYDQEVGRPLVASEAGNRSDIETETVVAYQVAPTLLESFGRLQAASGQDANHGHGHLIPSVATSLVPFSIMPMNSGKDYKAREVDVAQPLMASGPVGGNQGGNQGGDYVVQPVAFSSKDYGGDAGDISPTLRAMGHDGSHANGGGQVAVAFSLRGREGGAMPEVESDDVSPALRAADGGSTRPFIAFDETQITSKANGSNPQPGDPSHPLTAAGRPPTLANTAAVRRITVVEAERLQGFRNNATLINWPSAHRKGVDLAETIAYLQGHGLSLEDAQRLAQTPDGPRYKAIGNSWPVPVARWIGERIMAEMPDA